MDLRPTLIPLILLAPLVRAEPPAESRWAALADGEIRYTTPAGWAEVPLKDADGKSAVYNGLEGSADVTIRTTPQKQPIPDTPAVAQQLGRQVLKSIQESLKTTNAEILDEPRLERDPRFFVRIRDRIRSQNVIQDRLHLYRVMGYHFVMVIANVRDQTPEQVEAAYQVAADLLEGAVVGKRGGKLPTTKPTTRQS